MAIWSFLLQIWHSLCRVEEDNGIEFGTPPLKKLIKVSFKAATWCPMDASAAPSSSSSLRGSSGVSPSSPSTRSSSEAAPTSSSISAKVRTTHNFRISDRSLTRNLLHCSASVILPLWNSLSKCSKYFWTLSLGSCFMASSLARMSSSSTFPYFCKINALSSTQSTGASCNLLNQSRALPRRLSLTILKSLSALRSRTSAATVSLSAQSVTSSCSRP